MKAITIEGVIYTQTDFKEFNNYSTSGVGDAQWETWGFRDIIEPTLLSNERNTGELIYVPENDNYTYVVITLTDFDIESELLTTLNSSPNAILEHRLEEEGRLEYTFMRNKMRESWDNGTITYQENKQLRKYVKPILSKLKEGDWDIVQDDLVQLLIDNPGIPSNLVTIINQIQNRVDTYMIEKFN